MFEKADTDHGGSLDLDEFLEAFGGVLGSNLSHEQLIINHEKTYQLLPGGANPKDALKESANRLQMVGRLLITAIFVYCAPPPPSHPSHASASPVSSLITSDGLSI